MNMNARAGICLCVFVLAVAGCSRDWSAQEFRNAETVFFVQHDPMDTQERSIVFRTDKPEVIGVIASEVERGMARRTKMSDIPGVSVGYLLLAERRGAVTSRLEIDGDGAYREGGYEYDTRALVQVMNGMIEDGTLQRVHSWETDRLPDFDDLEPFFDVPSPDRANSVPAPEGRPR